MGCDGQAADASSKVSGHAGPWGDAKKSNLRAVGHFILSNILW